MRRRQVATSHLRVSHIQITNNLENYPIVQSQSKSLDPMNAFVPLQNPEAVISMLSQISIFGGVTTAQQNAIFSQLEIGTVKKGEYIFRKGDEPSHIYIVRSGRIELFIPDKGAMVEKKILAEGECFGQVALMSIHQHTISAVALEDSEIILLSRRALYRLHRENIELFALLMMNIARELARRLQFTDELLLKSIHMHDTICPEDQAGGGSSFLNESFPKSGRIFGSDTR